MTVEQSIEDPNDQFPVGMRVLAVDDDPTCLLLLETLLRRCQYHVTTTSQAITALKMLRENKNRFDLVISDVHMPDMDGFKLLELVGLEMDLPVIMLSANGDTKLVMKGITHGACDYLLKPVRIEELQNIWQHVIRRKKFDPKDKINSGNHDKTQFRNGGGFAGMGNVDQSGKLNKRRKDPNEDDDEEHDDNGLDIEDPSAQKKPRVVWSVELHRKFVNAVNQLGIDKAVPKRILDLMNVEKLTRENVASHLQKYRLYLKRISSVASLQQHSTLTDSSYMQINSLNQFKNLHTLAGSSSQYHNNSYFQSNPNSGMLDRLNTPYNMGIQTLPSPSRKFRLNNSINYSKHNINSVGDFSPALRILNGLPDEKLTVASSSNNPTLTLSNMSLVSSSGQCQETQGVQFGHLLSQSSVSPGFVNNGLCNDSWMTPVQSSRVEANAFLPSSSQMSCSSSSIRCDRQIITDMPFQGWENSVVDVNDGAAQMLGDGSMVFSGNEDFDLIARSEFLGHPEKVKDSFGSLEDLARAMTKQEQDGVKLLEGEFGCDSTYALGTCI